MSGNQMNSDNAIASRRKILKLVGGSAGIATLPGMASASETDISAQVVQAGVKTEETFEETCTTIIPDIAIDDEAVFLRNPTNQTMSTFENNDVVLHSHENAPRYSKLPTVVFDNQQRKEVTTELTGGVHPANVATSIDSVNYKPFKLRLGDNDSVIVQHQNQKTRVGRDDAVSISLGKNTLSLPPESKGGEKRETTFSSVAIIANHHERPVKTID